MGAGFIVLYGIYKVLAAAWVCISFMIRHLRQNPDFKQKYGAQGSYVVVTGGSDGIGLEICHQMAQ